MQRLPFPLHKRANRAVISVSGDDAKDFLQNLVTADIAALKPGQAAYSALLQPQGKILFDFFIVCRTSAMRSTARRRRGPISSSGSIFYKLRAKVTLSRRDEDVGVAIMRPDSGLVYTDPRAAQLGARLIAPQGSAAARSRRTAYRGGRIRLGLADSDEDIGSGELFPHEANLDQFGAVSFKQGLLHRPGSRLAHGASRHGAQPNRAGLYP